MGEKIDDHLKDAMGSIQIVLKSRAHLADDVVGAYLKDASDNIIWALKLARERGEISA